MIEGVIFDVGGVLAKDVWEWLLPARNMTGGIAERYGLDKEEVHKVGELLWEAFAYTPEVQRTTWPKLERRYWGLFIKFFWGDSPPNGASIDEFVSMTSDYIELVDHRMPDFLETLRSKGIKLGICSNNNEFWFRRQMDQLELYRYFSPSKIILSCRVGVSKSSRAYEMFYTAAEAMNLTPSHCAFVDDRKGNVERAIECDMKGIEFRSLDQLRNTLR